MANRINNYTLFRKIHLYAAFSSIGFILMYFITGFMITHSNWFPQPEHKVTSENRPLEIKEDMDLEQQTNQIQDTFGLRGQRIAPTRVNDETLLFEYRRPGFVYKVFYTPREAAAWIETTETNAHRTITVFHRVHGYGGGFVYDLFAFIMDLSSLALLVFVITGIYMWIKLIKNKTLGIVILSATIIYTLIVVVSFLFD